MLMIVLIQRKFVYSLIDFYNKKLNDCTTYNSVETGRQGEGANDREMKSSYLSWYCSFDCIELVTATKVACSYSWCLLYYEYEDYIDICSHVHVHVHNVHVHVYIRKKCIYSVDVHVHLYYAYIVIVHCTLTCTSEFLKHGPNRLNNG